MAKERPIIMTGESVRAIMTCAKCGTMTVEPKCPKCGSIEFLKGQTRRVIKPQPPEWLNSFRPIEWPPKEGDRIEFMIMADTERYVLKCPYGVVGDRLWCKETYWHNDPFHAGELMDVKYVATDKEPLLGDKDPMWPLFNWVKKPSIFMFKWAARIWLEITGIRVERVQEITNEDAIAEGINNNYIDKCRPFFHANSVRILAFKKLWDSINAQRGYGWDTNCWVWVIEFRKIKAWGSTRK